MDRLTAVRTFAVPGFCPAKRVRIYDDRWYSVRFQNVETDPRCDYVGLAEGEYTELLPGDLARRERDRRLNHCNAISEWTGNVYRLDTGQYGHANNRPTWYGYREDADAAVAAFLKKRDDWISACRKEAGRYFAETVESLKARALKTGFGSAYLSGSVSDEAHWISELAMRQLWGRESQAAADKEIAHPTWTWSITQIR